MSKLLAEGDVFELEKGDTVYMRLPAHFAYMNAVGVFDEMATTEVTVGESHNGMLTEWMLGEYVVTKTVHDGGGTGHGAHDIYPDGHHVYAERFLGAKEMRSEQPRWKIDFYQTGAFTAMITRPIKVIGKAKAFWVKERAT